VEVPRVALKEPIMVMFNHPPFAYPYPPMSECLAVFAILFFAGYLWATCIHWYIRHRMGGISHE